MKEPFIPIEVRVPRKLWLDLHKAVFSRDNPDGKFGNFSESLRFYMDLGVKAESLMKEIKNPEFVKEIEALRDQTKHYEILESMDGDTRKALALALDVVENHKWEQKKFV